MRRKHLSMTASGVPEAQSLVGSISGRLARTGLRPRPRSLALASSALPSPSSFCFFVHDVVCLLLPTIHVFLPLPSAWLVAQVFPARVLVLLVFAGFHAVWLRSPQPPSAVFGSSPISFLRAVLPRFRL